MITNPPDVVLSTQLPATSHALYTSISEVPGFLDRRRAVTTEAFRFRSLFDTGRCWLDLPAAEAMPPAKWGPFVQHTVLVHRQLPEEGDCVRSQHHIVNDYLVPVPESGPAVRVLEIARTMFDGGGRLFARTSIDGIIESSGGAPATTRSGTFSAATALANHVTTRFGTQNLRSFRTRISEYVSPTATFDLSLDELSDYDLDGHRQLDLRVTGMASNGSLVQAWASCRVV